MLGHRVNPESPFGPLLAHGWRQADLPADAWIEAWSCFETDLETLTTTARSLGIPLLVVGTPSRFTISDEMRDNLRFVPKHRLQADFCDRLGEACERAGIPYLDGRRILQDAIAEARRQSGHRPACFIIDDMTHLDPDGHDAVAAAVAAELTRSGMISVPLPSNRPEEPTSRTRAGE